MKIIKNVDAKLSHFSDDFQESEGQQLPTYRRLFKAAVGMTMGKNPEDTIDLYQLGLKIKIDGVDIELEEAEFRMLSAACKNNPAQWTSHYHGQVLLKLGESEAK